MDKKQANPTESSLLKTLKESDLSAVTADLADRVAEGLVGVPIVGTIVGLYRSAGTISDYLFTKKLLKFLTELKDVPQEQRRKQIDQLVVNDQFSEQVGERILLLLDKMSDMGKPTLMGRAYRAFLEGRIDLDQLRDLCHALDLLDLSYLEILQHLYDPNRVESRRYPFTLGNVQHLVMCGLLQLHFEARHESFDIGEGVYKEGPFLEGGKLGFDTNDLGELFVKIMLGDSVGSTEK